MGEGMQLGIVELGRMGADLRRRRERPGAVGRAGAVRHVTGDLAHKMIFPALQAMVQHEHLDVPVIGVAREGWSLDRLRARAKDSLGLTRKVASTRRRSRSSRRSCATSRATTRTTRPSTACARRSGRPSGRCTTWRSRPACSPRWWRRSIDRARPKGRAWSSRSHSGAISRRRAGSIARSSRFSTRRRSSASTITSGRSRCRTCSTSASPTRCSSRCGAATTSRACRSPWPKTSAWPGEDPACTRRPARSGTSSRNHMLQVVACLAMEAPAQRQPRGDRATRSAPSSTRWCRSIRTASSAARSPATSTSRGSRRTRASRRSRPCASTSTAGAGRACPSTSAPARVSRSRAPRCSSR